MPVQTTPPMTDKDYGDCNAALKDIDRVLKELAVALKGGAPCEGQIEGLNELAQQYERWKKAYWPDRP